MPQTILACLRHRGLVRQTLSLATWFAAMTTMASCVSQPTPEAPAQVIADAALPLTSDRDLDRVVEAVGDARIVMLGEPWHGDGAAIELRARLVERLHRAGFDVLAFEADFYAVNQAWREVENGADARLALRDEIFSFWTQTAVTERLWSYIADAAHTDRPLRIAGIDTQLAGARSRANIASALEQQFNATGTIAPADASEAAHTLGAALRGEFDGLTPAHFERLIALLGRLEHDTRDPFWRQMAESLRRNLTDGSRDPGMGDNLIWLASTLYPNSRIIVWAHNNHALSDASVYTQSSDPFIQDQLRTQSAASVAEITYLGAEARQFFGDDLYSIATLSYEGEYSSDIPAALASGRNGAPADFSLRATLAPTPAGTLEAALAERGPPILFADLRRLDISGPVASRALDYAVLPPLSLRLDRGYDGVLFVRQTYPLTGRQ